MALSLKLSIPAPTPSLEILHRMCIFLYIRICKASFLKRRKTNAFLFFIKAGKNAKPIPFFHSRGGRKQMEDAFCYGFQKEYSIIKETLNLECYMEPNHPRHQKRPNGHHPCFQCIFEMLLTFVESAKLLSWMIIGFAFQNFERQKEINNLARGLHEIYNVTYSLSV